MGDDSLADLTRSDWELSRGSGKGKEWVISRMPLFLTSRPRRDPETKLGRDSWQCLTIFSTACSGIGDSDGLGRVDHIIS